LRRAAEAPEAESRNPGRFAYVGKQLVYDGETWTVKCVNSNGTVDLQSGNTSRFGIDVSDVGADLDNAAGESTVEAENPVAL
jgi:hypothetical protein